MNFPTLQDVARQVAFEQLEQTTHKLQLALYHAVQAVKRLTFDVNPQRLRADLVVRTNRTVQLPADAVGLSSLLTSTGEPLLDDPTPLGTRAGVRTGRQTTADGSYTTSGRGRAFGAETPLTNTAGHYHLDAMSGLITLSPDCPVMATQTLVAIYSGTGIAAQGNTLVHPWSEQFIISYVQCKMMKFNRAIGLGEKQLAEKEWKDELRLAAKRFKSSTKAEWLQALSGRQRRTL